MCLCGLVQCGDTASNEGTPAINQDEMGIVPRLSSLYIPITYDLASLEDLVNQKIKGKFLKKKVEVEERKAELNLEFTRTHRIRLRWDNQTLYYSVPLTIQGYFKKKTIGITLKNQKAIEAKVVVHLASHLDFDEEWKVLSTSRLVRLEWMEEPQLHVAFINLNLRGVIENYLAQNDKDLLSALDHTIREALPLQEVVYKLWQDIQKPVLINRKEQKVWLKSVATTMQAEFRPTLPQHIGLGVMLHSFVFAGIDTTDFIPSNGIPPNNVKESMQRDSLEVYILARLKLEEINSFLNERLHQKSLEYAGYKATISQVHVYGSENKLVVKAKIDGDVKADIFLSGIPHYHQATHTLGIKQFEYKVTTSQTVVHLVNEYFYQEVLAYFKEKLTHSLEAEVTSLPQIIHQGIRQGQLGQKIHVEFSPLTVEMAEHKITGSEVQFLLVGKGQAHMQLQKNLFTKKK
jgi:hypothetical protein